MQYFSDEDEEERIQALEAQFRMKTQQQKQEIEDLRDQIRRVSHEK